MNWILSYLLLENIHWFAIDLRIATAKRGLMKHTRLFKLFLGAKSSGFWSGDLIKPIFVHLGSENTAVFHPGLTHRIWTFQTLFGCKIGRILIRGFTPRLSTLGSKTLLISTRGVGIDTPIPESERSNFVANAWSIRIETAHAARTHLSEASTKRRRVSYWIGVFGTCAWYGGKRFQTPEILVL